MDVTPSVENAYITTIKMGPKGQIVIPKEVRTLCRIEPGQNLVLVAGKEGGILVHTAQNCSSVLARLMDRLPSGENDGI